MGEIIALLGQIITRLATALGLLSNIQSIVNLLSGSVSNTALQTTLVDTEDDVVLVLTNVQDPSYGLSALSVQIAEAQTVLLSAITATQQSGSPVTLPTVPPPGYGGSGASAFDVWNDSGNVPPYDYGTKGWALNAILNYLTEESDIGFFPVSNSRWVGFHYGAIDPTYGSLTGPYPDVDPSTILSTDASIGDWLNRTTGYTWTALDQGWVSYDVPEELPDSWYVCLMNDLQFAQFQASGAAVAVLVPPVWPGYDRVTIGAPVTLEGGVALTTPCDGVLVEIFSVPAKQGYFTFDSAISWRNVGAIAFYEASSRVEMPQLLGFENAIYCPKTMTTSAGCHIRALAGVTGFVYPWSITA